MVMARLHVICGNCGCADEWELSIQRDGEDVSMEETKFEDSAWLTCDNCGTLHDLKAKAKKFTAHT